MLADFDIPVIETYTQLAGVITGVVLAALACRRAWRMLRPQHMPKLQPSRPVRAAAVAPAKDEQEFASLAALVSRASDRAAAISDTQAKAAIKIDSTEIALARLLAELSAVTQVREPVDRMPHQETSRTPVALPAHPLPPSPQLSALAA